MSTLSDLANEVRVVTEDLPPEVDSEVEQFIRDAQTEGEDRHIFLAMETTATFITAPGVQKLSDKPTLWLRRIDRPAWINGLTGSQRSFEWSRDISQLLALYQVGTGPGSTGAPKHLLERTTELWVYPLPDQLNPIGLVEASGNYPVVIPYATRFALLDAPTKTNWLTDNGRVYLVARAVAEAFFLTRDFDAAALWLGRARNHLARLVRIDKRMRFHQSETLAPSLDSARRGGPSRPW